METKENWIENILYSTNGITQVLPNDDLFEKINQKINEHKVIPINTLWLVAATIIILLGLNIFLFTNYNHTSSNKTIAFEQIVNQNNQLYN